MGGDFAPEAAVKGAVMALDAIGSDSRIVLFGDEEKIKAVLAAEKCPAERFDIVATTEVIEMGDHPAKAFQSKADSSITVGFGYLAKGAIDGFASAGSTGAMMVGSMYAVKPIEGVIRPTISSIVPTASGRPALLLDVGLNVDCKPEVLAQYGLIGSIYAEAVLAQETRVVESDGTVLGGPVYYIKRAFPNGFGKFLAGFFAVAIILALGFMGSMVQSNSIGEACQNAFHIPSWVMGLIVSAIAAFIFIGGVQRIASVTEKIVPVMACLYLVGGLIVLFARIRYVPETFGMIFKYAFVPQSIIGGGIGYALKTAISQGAKRGLFSNEAGMGSTPHAHALANVKSPHEQGTVAMIGVFIDTFVVLTMTALVVISTLYAGNGPLAHGAVDGISKTNMAQLAFSSVFGDTLGNAFVAICLLFFAFSTIVGWNLFGRINVNYLFGKKANLAYSIIAIIFIFLGSCLSNDLVWELTDMFNQLMVLPNMIALVALSGIVAVAARKRSDEHELRK